MKSKRLIGAVMACGMAVTTMLAPLSTASFTSLAAGAADAFYGISLTKGYKSVNDHNPCVTQKFSADPGAMEYNGRVYVYATNDGDINQARPKESNTYAQINQINVMSTADMVNWTDHGSIDAAGRNGAARWANNSWAPCAAHKKINGKEKFFLYFANSGGGIGVLTSDSPTGPWKDPIGKALITRNTPNCRKRPRAKELT
jgi:arabinoxylan arabinofuranohydrolase